MMPLLRMPEQYVLNADRQPVREETFLVWARWFDSADRIVRQEWVGPLWVSTVFIGINTFPGAGPPIVFETQIFFADEVLGGARCATWADAEKMHESSVAYARTWWQHPVLLAHAFRQMLEGWMYRWDTRFAGRYGKMPSEEW